MDSSLPFVPSRNDGRSDARVVVDLVGGAAPGTVFSYADLQAALEVGTDRCFTRAVVGAAVRRANRALLPHHQRVLHSVATVGYRLAPAAEHTALAQGNERRADAQLHNALLKLRHVRWDEMDAPNRAAHQAHLQITSALVQSMALVKKEVNKQNDAITKLVRRVETLEGADAGTAG